MNKTCFLSIFGGGGGNVVRGGTGGGNGRRARSGGTGNVITRAVPLGGGVGIGRSGNMTGTRRAKSEALRRAGASGAAKSLRRMARGGRGGNAR
jgi:hypothetical protein